MKNHNCKPIDDLLNYNTNLDYKIKKIVQEYTDRIVKDFNTIYVNISNSEEALRKNLSETNTVNQIIISDLSTYRKNLSDLIKKYETLNSKINEANTNASNSLKMAKSLIDELSKDLCRIRTQITSINESIVDIYGKLTSLNDLIKKIKEDLENTISNLEKKVNNNYNDLISKITDAVNSIPVINGSNTVLVTKNNINYYLNVILSTDEGNLLQNRPNGLYYGIVAPEDIRLLYCNTETGKEDNDGSKANPINDINIILQKILDRNVGGTYTICLCVGQTFTINKFFYFNAQGVSINIQFYNDPTFDDFTGKNAYFPCFSDNINRPKLIWDTVQDGVLVVPNCIGGDISSFALDFRGIHLITRNTAGITTGGGWFFYMTSLTMYGCDITVEGTNIGLGSATNIILFNNKFFNPKGKVPYFVSDKSPQIFINNGYPGGTVMKDPYGKLPDVVARQEEQYSALTVQMACAMTEYAYDSKSKIGVLYGYSCNWNPFKYSNLD